MRAGRCELGDEGRAEQSPAASAMLASTSGFRSPAQGHRAKTGRGTEFPARRTTAQVYFYSPLAQDANGEVRRRGQLTTRAVDVGGARAGACTPVGGRGVQGGSRQNNPCQRNKNFNNNNPTVLKLALRRLRLVILADLVCTVVEFPRKYSLDLLTARTW